MLYKYDNPMVTGPGPALMRGFKSTFAPADVYDDLKASGVTEYMSRRWDDVVGRNVQLAFLVGLAGRQMGSGSDMM